MKTAFIWTEKNCNVSISNCQHYRYDNNLYSYKIHQTEIRLKPKILFSHTILLKDIKYVYIGGTAALHLAMPLYRSSMPIIMQSLYNNLDEPTYSFQSQKTAFSGPNSSSAFLLAFQSHLQPFSLPSKTLQCPCIVHLCLLLCSHYIITLTSQKTAFSEPNSSSAFLLAFQSHLQPFSLPSNAYHSLSFSFPHL